ncbi:restriction endonuclease subunit S [Aeromonas hydrophila]|uniref:restriction endonuclease subunit S n=1 Tax=Aeromonas hydrophila TaxID=644 RepID=UPI0038D0CDA7
MIVKNNVPEIRFKGFSDEWVQHNLGKLIDIRSAARVHKEQWTESGVPFFRTSDVVSIYKGQENTKAFISYDVYKELTGRIGKVSSGDLLVTGGGSIGIPFLVPNDEPLYFKDADLLWFKNDQKFDGYFLYTFLFSETFKKYIKSISHIGTIAHYTIEQAKSTPINNCERAEQTAIGNTFHKLDNLINQHQQKHDKLSNIKKAMLEKMFPKQGETIPEIRFKGFSGEWKERSWRDTVDISTNMVDPRCSQYGELFHVGPGNIESFTGMFYNNVLKVKDSNLISGKFYFNEGDIIYGKINPQLAKYVIAPFEGLASADAYVLNTKNGVVQNYLYVILQTEDFYKYTVSVSSRTGMPKINRDELNIYTYLSPDEAEQHKIGNYFQKLDALINQHQQQITKLNNIKQACLSKMFV